MKPTLLFAPETFNIAETTRMIEIAKALRDEYECRFSGYSEEYAYLIREAGFAYHALEPQLSPEQVAWLWKVDRMEAFGNPFKPAMLRARVASETALIEKIGAKAVIMGFTLSYWLSAKAAKVPLVYVIPFPLSRPFLEAGLARWPARYAGFPFSLVGSRRLDERANSWFLRTRLWIGPFAAVAKEFGVAAPKRLVDIFEGDYNLVTDIPELAGVTKLPDNWRYVGFIYARLDTPVPPGLLDRGPGRPLIYCAMGSSANRQTLEAALRSLGEGDWDVVCPARKHLGDAPSWLPANVRLTDWLPAPEVNAAADAAVIHGGQGTVQTAIMAGKPFVGIGLQPEQEANVEAAVRFGSALALSPRQVAAGALPAALRRVLEEPGFKEAARRLRDLAAGRDGVAGAAAFVRELVTPVDRSAS